MDSNERTFILRFSLAATIPDEFQEDEDLEEDAWLDEWETAIKPVLLRAIFAHLRSFQGWEAHVRNRGMSSRDEIEIALTRRYEKAPTKRGP